MENIRQAVERARASSRSKSGFEPQRSARQFGDLPQGMEYSQEIQLDTGHLQSQRIVAYDGTDLNSRPFDMLRTEVLRSMDLMDWKTVAVTSPTPDCGKTLTAINLALSMSRQHDRQVLLADLDFRKPRVAACSGLNCKEGALGVIEHKVDLRSAIVRARVGDSRLGLLPTGPAPNSSDLVSSPAMRDFLEETKQLSQSQTIIFDLPPLLAGHDAISILPYVDCVLLVAAVGTTRVSELQEANKYLADSSIVRVVLNKVPASINSYVYY
jgi:protein-tyrosine kinase